jgi:hypothetical protein
MEVGKISNNPYSTKILRRMEIRQKQLFKNDAIRAALYLDPRFSFTGSSILQPSDVELAQVSNKKNKCEKNSKYVKKKFFCLIF